MTYIHDQGQWKNFIYRMNFEIFNFSIYYLTNRIWIFNPDVIATFPNKNLGVGSHVLTSFPRSAASVHIHKNTSEIRGLCWKNLPIEIRFKIYHIFRIQNPKQSFSDFGLLYFITWSRKMKINVRNFKGFLKIR